MPAGEFPAAGYYERNTDGSLKLNSANAPVFHPETSRHRITWPVGPDNSAITSQGWFSLSTGFGEAKGHIWFIGTFPNGTPDYLTELDFDLPMDVRRVWQAPANTDQISVQILTTADCSVGWALEIKAK